MGARSGEAPFKIFAHSQRWTDFSERLYTTCWSPAEGTVMLHDQTSPSVRLSKLCPCVTSSVFPLACLFYSSTWLKTRRPSWKASLRDRSNSHLLISLMWVLIRTTPGSSCILHPKFTPSDFTFLESETQTQSLHLCCQC